MLSINRSDVIGTIQTIRPYLITLAVIVAGALSDSYPIVDLLSGLSNAGIQ